MSDLFRREAVSHATQRLSGAVVLATPLSVRVLGLFFGVIVLAAVIFVSMATYARKATVTGWLVPDQGLIRATASSAGFIQGVFVKEGDAVERGARLAQIRIGADTAAGNVGDMVIQQLRAEVEKRQSAALAAEQELAGLQRQISAMEREISDIGARISAILIEKETIRAESQSAAASVEQRSIDAEARRVQWVLSPVAGRIAALPGAEGQPVSLGGTVAIVIPEGARIEAELLAPSSGAGFIRPGQEVRLMLQAFPYQRFGTVKGAVKTISKTVLGPTEISIPGLKIEEPVFRVRVTLPRDEIDAYGEPIPLQPGMLLSADVIFDRRSLIQWLFDPLFAVARRT